MSQGIASGVVPMWRNARSEMSQLKNRMTKRSQMNEGWEVFTPRRSMNPTTRRFEARPKAGSTASADAANGFPPRPQLPSGRYVTRPRERQPARATNARGRVQGAGRFAPRPEGGKIYGWVGACSLP